MWTERNLTVSNYERSGHKPVHVGIGARFGKLADVYAVSSEPSQCREREEMNQACDHAARYQLDLLCWRLDVEHDHGQVDDVETKEGKS